MRIVYLEDLRSQFGVARQAVADGVGAVAAAQRDPQPRPGGTAVVLFTSGSEARPKGVALSHRAILANIAQMDAVIDFGPNDKFLIFAADVPRLRPDGMHAAAAADSAPACTCTPRRCITT